MVYDFDFLNPWEHVGWDNLSAEEQREVNYKELLKFAKDIQQRLDDNPHLVDEMCCCSGPDDRVGHPEVICDIHILPGILRRIEDSTKGDPK